MAEYKPQVVQLKQSGQDIIPITTAEAVLVKEGDSVTKLVDYLNRLSDSGGDTSYTFNSKFFTVNKDTKEVSLIPNLIKGIKTHICIEGEIKDNGEPDIANPDDNTIYLVLRGEEFNEYIRVESEGKSKWELLGSTNVDAVMSRIGVLEDQVDNFNTQLEVFQSQMITSASPIASQTINVEYGNVTWENIFNNNN